ncbi:MAG: 2TM domain-containing protein [Cyclobacteriaceae bacterium]|nr:2TM domain-containing protein [Cyclobacteriaceae bacterium]UYN88267.1 MAG: 2TM domain-containing protein [Cyclobacteriaceae bacterium]
MNNNDDKLYREARKRVKRKKEFYSHLLSYITICLFLTFINWYSNPGHWWVQWVWLGWGIGIFFHGLSLFRKNFVFGDEWEEKEIQKEMERMRKQ